MNKIILTLVSALLFSSCTVEKNYNENGTLKSKGRISNDLKNGQWKIYHENGKLFQVGDYLDGKETGDWKFYHENGKLHQYGAFKNGKQDGEWHFIHPNGVQQGIGTLDEAKKIGIWKWYFDNGQLQTQRSWNNGKLIEIVSCNDGQGNELDRGTLINGTGTMKLYDSNGKLLETLVYKNGEIVK